MITYIYVKVFFSLLCSWLTKELDCSLYSEFMEFYSILLEDKQLLFMSLGGCLALRDHLLYIVSLEMSFIIVFPGVTLPFFF